MAAAYEVEGRDWQVVEKEGRQLTRQSILCPCCPSSPICTPANLRDHFLRDHVPGGRRNPQSHLYILLLDRTTYDWKELHGRIDLTQVIPLVEPDYSPSRLRDLITNAVRDDLALQDKAFRYRSMYRNVAWQKEVLIPRLVSVMEKHFKSGPPSLGEQRGLGISKTSTTKLRGIPTACLAPYRRKFLHMEYDRESLSPSLQACFLLAADELTELQWVAFGLGELETSHLCGNETCIMVFHAVLETHTTNVSRKWCNQGRKCEHDPKCRTYAFSDPAGPAEQSKLRSQLPRIRKLLGI
ncbi:hypothetical protein LTR17_003186 [Elasticomyces elasticus]|nr:hypothetical protein LTR17_003186 [Elasticomyces elasticus]